MMWKLQRNMDLEVERRPLKDTWAYVNLMSGLLLLLLHQCQLCLTLCDPIDGTQQAPLSLQFSRQEHWIGLPFPSLMHESESEVAQSCPTLSDPMDCSLLGSSVRGIFQARVLKWVAIAFSGIYDSTL